MIKNSIKLEKLIFFGFHGINKNEIKKGQNFILDLYINYIPINNSDNLEDYIDYIELYNLIKLSFKEKRFNLLESLGTKIINDIKKKYKSIIYIKLIMRKPSIVIDSNKDFINVEVEYRK